MPAQSARPTMRDVAGAAGVAIKTVSRVMNGEPNVTPETTERVLRAASELGYVLHRQASDLRRRDGGPGAIGILLSSVGNAFDSRVHRSVERVVAEAKMMTLAASTGEDPEVELERLTGFISRRLRGLILLTIREEHSLLMREIDRGWPVVLVDREADDVAADLIITDGRAGIIDAVTHLRSHGHRRIAFLSNMVSIRTSRERLAGFREATADLEHSPIVTDLADDATVAAALDRLFAAPQPPTAIVAARNNLSISTVRWLQRHGLQHQVGLVGFDDVPLSDLVEPGITVIAQDPDALGTVAAQRLLARIGGEEGPPQRIVLPTRLIPRGSGELPAHH